MNQPELSQNNQPTRAGAGKRGNGITFLFKNDDRGTATYISSENGVSPEEALETFFSGDSRWNAEQSRFETYTGSHGLFWYWLQKGKTVVVITCFRSSGNEFTKKNEFG